MSAFNSPEAAPFWWLTKVLKHCSRALMEWFRYAKLRGCPMGQAARESGAEDTGTEARRSAAQTQILRRVPQRRAYPGRLFRPGRGQALAHERAGHEFAPDLGS